MVTASQCSLSLTAAARQSPPIDFNTPTDLAFVRGKTILITGGASGIGAGICTKMAEEGAIVIIGDINVDAGSSFVTRLRAETGNEDINFLPLDVTSWSSQLTFFREAAALSPHGGIDTVIVNAGVNIGSEAFKFEMPSVDYENNPGAPPPALKTVEVNLTGAMYTTHLALDYLARNPGSAPCSPTCDISKTTRDRHILFLGSLASLYPIVSQIPYCVSKHGVLGIFRSLRVTAPLTSGVRVNLLCPYFTDSPFINTMGRIALAGVALGTIDDVVKAASRLLADPRCIGRSVVIGPKLRIREPNYTAGEQLATGSSSGVPDVTDIYEFSKPSLDEATGVVSLSREDFKEVSIWECYAHDLEDTEVFCTRMARLLNAASVLKSLKGRAGCLHRVSGAMLLATMIYFIWKWAIVEDETWAMPMSSLLLLDCLFIASLPLYMRPFERR